MSAAGLQAAWEGRGPVALLLWPVSLLYGLSMRVRAVAYSRGWFATRRSPVPVIVVGNLSVGGTGKTPLCAWLAHHLIHRGRRVGIVSRGHGGTARVRPHTIDPDVDRADDVGDEPWMLARQTGVPVCVCVDRPAAVAHLAHHHRVDVVLSDDGLQHLAMQRHVELVVVDAARGFGNGWVLPAGPLRESISRLASVDALIVNLGSAGNGEIGTAREPGTEPGAQSPPSSAESPVRPDAIAGLPPGLHSRLPGQGAFFLNVRGVRRLAGEETLPLCDFEGQSVHAVAGIGHPERFFDSLRRAGLSVIPHPMPDHHAFQVSDVTFGDALPVLVTSKDAVKLAQLDQLPASVYEVPVELVPDAALRDLFDRLFDDRLTTIA